MVKVAAVIPAAGQGRRMQTPVNKQFLLLQGMPVIVHTLQAFEDCSEIAEVFLVCAKGEGIILEDLIGQFGIKKVVRIVTGGAERQESVHNGLKALAVDTDIVLVHDGARPLVEEAVIKRVISAAREYGAAITGVQVKDTIKTVNGSGMVEKTLEREGLYQVQTPQGFRYDLIMEAHRKAANEGFLGTDEAMLVERLGVGVRMVPGAYENIKITTAEDMILAEALLTRRGSRCG